MIIITILLGVFLVLSLFINWNLYKKIVFFEAWYENLAEIVETMYIKLTELDRLGAMESDDEIGFFFDALKDLTHELFSAGFYDTEASEEVNE